MKLNWDQKGANGNHFIGFLGLGETFRPYGQSVGMFAYDLVHFKEKFVILYKVPCSLISNCNNFMFVDGNIKNFFN